jgi:hypothetical protein
MKEETTTTKTEEINPLVLKLKKLRNNKDASRLIQQTKQKNNKTTNNN